MATAKKDNGSISERIRYFRGLRGLIGGAKQSDHDKLKQNIECHKFRNYWNNMIWLELQAWQYDRDVLEQDQWLMNMRQTKIPKVIKLFKEYHFNDDTVINAKGISNTDFLRDSAFTGGPKQFLDNSLLLLSNQYFEYHYRAFKQVDDMLEELSFVEHLFSSTSNLKHDFPEYANPYFQLKVGQISAWYNTSLELAYNLTAAMEMIGNYEFSMMVLTLHKTHQQQNGVTSNTHAMSNHIELSNAMSDGSADVQSCTSCEKPVKFSELISKMAESYLHKYNAVGILSMLLSNHLGCLIRSCQFLQPTPVLRNLFDEKNNLANLSGISSLLEDVKQCFPDEACTETYKSLRASKEDNKLPSLYPFYSFLLDLIFAVMEECLKLRLQQAQECRKQCGSTTSLLTVQQVVYECKEVIQCSLLTMTIYCSLHRAVCDEDILHNQLMKNFKMSLMRMLETYLDFVKMWIVAQLSGLPHAPRTFVETLQIEWKFSKEVTADIHSSLCVCASCKFINICGDLFKTTERFLRTASSAIFVSKAKKQDNEYDRLDRHFSEASEDHLFNRSGTNTSSVSAPTSPQAGILWFHRQRSESPHFARRHSSLCDEQPTLHLSLSAPLLNDKHTESNRRYLYELCRAVRDLFDEVRERSVRSLGFALTLRHDLESAIEFSFSEDETFSKKHPNKTLCKYCGFMHKLKEMGFVKLDLPWPQASTSQFESNHSTFHPSTHAIFAGGFSKPFSYVTPGIDILKCLRQRLMFCNSLFSPHGDAHENMLLLIVRSKSLLNCQDANHHRSHNSQHGQRHQRCGKWTGRVTTIDAEDIGEIGNDVIATLKEGLSLEYDVTVVTSCGYDIGRKRNEFCKVFGEYVKIEVAQCSIVKEIKEALCCLQQAILSYSNKLFHQIDIMGRHLQKQVACHKLQDTEEGQDLAAEANRVVQKSYNVGFEHLNGMLKLFSGPARHQVGSLRLSFLRQWMDYVTEWLPVGNGHRPRWAFTGLRFLTGFNMDVIRGLETNEYLELKKKIDEFVDHLIGLRPHKVKKLESIHNTETDMSIYRSLSSNSSRDDSSDSTPDIANKVSEDASFYGFEDARESTTMPLDQIRISVEYMEQERNRKKFEDGMIGRVLDTPNAPPLVQLSIRSVGFQWQRGNKIGEGAFGKVYPCVNMNSGRILAMKEISFQPYDEQRMKEALDEITNFEGISHPNLVKYYGVEMHRDQMFIFMDFCDSGTLEEASRIGLPEFMIQQYTAQLVTAISVLHHKGFVHRDIKGSNIFLTSKGLLKLGDFGSAVRLLNRAKTQAGEIASHHGITAAYTAPEVANRSEQKGYGRSADIWSLGCVVIEMATGKRPWHELEPFQILYQVGLGAKPTIPNSLGRDGQSFIEHCLEVDPSVRWNIDALQSHPFVKVAQSYSEFN